MIENPSSPPGTIVPRIIYDDVVQAIEWLCGAFGFTERLRTDPEADGTIHHAQLAVGDGSVILTGRSAANRGKARRPADANDYPASLSVRVESIDAHFERARKFGATILKPPRTYPYGERQYNAEDLAGYIWTFTQSVASVDPREWGARVAEIRSREQLLPRPRWCYLEIPAADVQRSAAFYERVFGWGIRDSESSRPRFDDATGNISGAWVAGRSSSFEPGLLPYVYVDSVEATLSKVKAEGGEVVRLFQLDSPGAEWIATFRDPAGNLIGLYQPGHGN